VTLPNNVLEHVARSANARTAAAMAVAGSRRAANVARAKAGVVKRVGQKWRTLTLLAAVRNGLKAIDENPRVFAPRADDSFDRAAIRNVLLRYGWTQTEHAPNGHGHDVYCLPLGRTLEQLARNARKWKHPGAMWSRHLLAQQVGDVAVRHVTRYLNEEDMSGSQALRNLGGRVRNTSRKSDRYVQISVGPNGDDGYSPLSVSFGSMGVAGFATEVMYVRRSQRHNYNDYPRIPGTQFYFEDTGEINFINHPTVFAYIYRVFKKVRR
jgi:hypothetical protein